VLVLHTSMLCSRHPRARMLELRRRSSRQDARACQECQEIRAESSRLEQNQANWSKIERTWECMPVCLKTCPEQQSNFGGRQAGTGVWWYVSGNITCHFVSRINGNLHKISLGFARLERYCRGTRITKHPTLRQATTGITSDTIDERGVD
jgi:hypothetical protein